MRPLFTVILPTYNRATLIAKAVRSVLEQRVEDWQLLIVDDGSTDDTRERLQEFFKDPRVSYLYQPNQGKSAARNTGIRAARGRYVCFLDSDDYWLPEHFTVLQKGISSAPQALTVFRTGMRTVGKNVEPKESALYDPRHFDDAFTFFATHMVGIHTLAYPWEVLQTYRYDTRFRYFQDSQLLLRVLRKYPLVQLPAVTAVYYRHSGQSATSAFGGGQLLDNLENNLAAIRSVFDNDQPLSAKHERLRRYMLSKKYYDYAAGALASGEIGLSWRLICKSIKLHRGLRLGKRYLKYLLSIPTKLVFDYPKLISDD